MYTKWQREQADTWLAAARAAGVTPLVSFGHSRTNRADLPTTARYLRAFRAFRERYPWVKTFATWNEANHCGEPTCQPTRAGRLLLARDQEGLPELPDPRRRAARLAERRRVGARSSGARRKVEPRYWGLHNYLDANRFTTSYTQAVLAATRGELWLTETGGIVAAPQRQPRARCPSRPRTPRRRRASCSRSSCASTRGSSASTSTTGTTSAARRHWDSALVASNGQARPAYDVLRDRLRRLRISGRLG